jgi:hypothetical protein
MSLICNCFYKKTNKVVPLMPSYMLNKYKNENNYKMYQEKLLKMQMEKFTRKRYFNAIV